MKVYLKSISLSVALLLLAGFVVALEQDESELTLATADADESEPAELNELVVLCAEEEEKKFEIEWSRYVVKNELKGKELQETINWVSDEAASQRKNSEQDQTDVKDDEAWKKERQKLMNELARRAQMI